MSGSRTSTAAAPTVGWMLGMSSWMLLTLVPGAMFTWLGFGILGVVVRRAQYFVFAVVWGALAILVVLPFWGQFQPVASAIVYLAGMLAALVVNPGWLRAMWERRRGGRPAAAAGSGVWHRRPEPAATPAQPTGRKRSGSKSSPASKSAPASKNSKAAAKAVKSTSTDAAGAASTSSSRPRDEARELATAAGASTSEFLAASSDAPAEPAEPVDVNTADADALATLPGVSRSRARRAVKARDEQGGFSSLEDFGEAIGLQPHEIVRLRRAATCSPRPRGERRFGRRVDY